VTADRARIAARSHLTLAIVDLVHHRDLERARHHIIAALAELEDHGDSNQRMVAALATSIRALEEAAEQTRAEVRAVNDVEALAERKP
jgi:hypothetical protein